MTLAELDSQQAGSLAEVTAAADAAALEQVRVRYLGRNGLLPAIIKQMKDVPAAERPEFGKRVQAWRAALERALGERVAGVGTAKKEQAAFDCTLPGRWPSPGAKHPVSRVIEETAAIFARLGFTVADGPDIETRFNNFTALNTPAHHPSMDASDTFWLTGDRLLRTQTSPVQIRMMTCHTPPIRIITPGRTYRRDTTDATHSANFHQIEGLYVDTKPVSLADLKSTLAYYAQEMMGAKAGVRFRPHFFPFTEPSVEVDFSCHVCGGKGCRVCKMSGWIEIAGAGMVDPRVYEHVNRARGDQAYDPAAVYGYAFGFGVERIAMVKYGIPDIRWLYENDTRFLSQLA
ncbi:MAG: phenylalanine--tRNA ligase subunit alpha [Lentisphaerae bacterium]|jgi:phenylalanyl-tRNA synthetase alpha chain|nr:phenylalanine--tRNA ligase subunit alpha [Kiritimatiellia bacterium]MDD4173441.1 phenylalanine--tRNA ligase subunit alpha [Kiritimatiellia bacterium]MDD4441331.1 phenylalanine--tRNA ligase subunit alpha [Kiritimatiellia bacterium]MDX9792097.1 phenylalanine--tRNA ligase subunit alpha [Kiritimatiellia bacterium]NLC83214.1 phenylalanine--tRNA ligase subunit alpha [Lentisphaerota bacterium]